MSDILGVSVLQPAVACVLRGLRVSAIECFCAPHRLPRPPAAPSRSGDLTELNAPSLSADAKSANLHCFSLPLAYQERISLWLPGTVLAQARADYVMSLVDAHPSVRTVVRTTADAAAASLRFASALDSPALASPQPPQGGCTYSLHGSTTWCAAAVRSGAPRPLFSATGRSRSSSS